MQACPEYAHKTQRRALIMHATTVKFISVPGATCIFAPVSDCSLLICSPPRPITVKKKTNIFGTWSVLDNRPLLSDPLCLTAVQSSGITSSYKITQKWFLLLQVKQITEHYTPISNLSEYYCDQGISAQNINIQVYDVKQPDLLTESHKSVGDFYILCHH